MVRVHFTEYDTRLAAYAVLTRADQLLLTWFNGRGGNQPSWTLPGGGVDFDESLSDAVVREVHEETGYDVAPGVIVAEHHFTGRVTPEGRPYRSQRFLFAATILGGDLGTTEVDGSTDFARWVPLAQIPDLQPRAEVIDLAVEYLTASSP